MTFNPIFTVVGIIGAVALLGYIISYFRASVNFSGYQEVAGDAQSVARAMKAEIFRDGDDLVISGNYGKLPAIVRFSYADNTPGLNISMKAPSGRSQSNDGRSVHGHQSFINCLVFSRTARSSGGPRHRASSTKYASTATREPIRIATAA